MSIQEKLIQTATTLDEIKMCSATMLQLRPHLDTETFVAQVQRQQQQQGYCLWYIEADDLGVSCLGYRQAEHLAWGKILYIDDFVTHSDYQGRGYASHLMRAAIDEARNLGCNQVHLDTGSTRHDAHRLYLKIGFQLSSYHMALSL